MLGPNIVRLPSYSYIPIYSIDNLIIKFCIEIMLFQNKVPAFKVKTYEIFLIRIVQPIGCFFL